MFSQAFFAHKQLFGFKKFSPHGGFSGCQLKYLALFFMALDHAAVILAPALPEILYYGMRTAGHMAFPLFAFLLTEGFFHTSDRRGYAGRLALFALLSELPYDLALGDLSSAQAALAGQNVFFTLLLGFLGMAYLTRAGVLGAGKGNVLAALIVFPLVGEFLHVDCGGAGVLTILLLFLLRRAGSKQAGQPGFLPLLIGFCPMLAAVFPRGLTILALLGAGGLAACYNGQRGQGSRLFFYLFYPVHLLFLHVIAISPSVGSFLPL